MIILSRNYSSTAAFDTEDQSMMARFENQKALNAYMDEMPFGIGMGAIDGVVPPHNKYYPQIRN